MRPSRFSRALCVIAGATAAIGSANMARAQNLFTNPSLETGDFTGWTVEPAGNPPTVLSDDVLLGAGPFRSNVRTGMYAAVSAAGQSVQSVFAQTVAVQPNTTYLVGGNLSIAGASPMFLSSLQITDSPVTNAVNARFLLTGGSTPADFVPVARLFTTTAGQTSATFRLGIPGGTVRVSLDDMFAQPYTAPLTSNGATGRLLTRGKPTPDGPDNVALVDASFLANGVVATSAILNSNSSTTASYVYRDDAPPLALRGGGATPDGPGTTSGINLRGVNDAADVLIRANLDNTGLSGTQRALYVVRDAQLNSVARYGQAAPGGGAFSNFGATTLGASGAVVFSAQAGSGADSLFLKSLGQPAVRIAYEQDGPGPIGAFFLLNGNSSINASNQVAFEGSTVGSGSGVYRYNGSTLTSVAQNGDLDGAGGTIAGPFSSPVINDAGHIAFAGTAESATGALYRYNGASVVRLATAGAAAPSGSSFARFNAPDMNNASQVAFTASLDDGGSGVYRAESSGALTLIARTGQPRPDNTGQSFGNFGSVGVTGTGVPPAVPAIAAGGQVAFAEFQPSAIHDAGIYLGDGIETIEVVRWGHANEHGAITDISWNTLPSIQLNDFGQLAYGMTLGDGSSSSVLFTPTLHWRAATSGSWSTNTNWTVGLAPAAVHPVKIDSPAGVTVTGPAGNTTVKSLDVTAGNELALAAGSNLTVTDGVTLAGTLSGSGVITGDVTNDGTISPGHSAGVITIDGDLTSPGRIDLELLGGSFDQLIVTGSLDLTGADIFVLGAADAGQTFNLITAGSITGMPTWHLPGESSFAVVPNPAGGQTVQVTYVPEPTAVAFAAISVAASVVRRRRRRIF